VSVVGNSGSGKIFVARRVAAVLGVPHIELDSLHHLAGWQPVDPATFRDQIDALTREEGWVVDGNYRAVVVDGPVWQRADAVVWIDLPQQVVMRQVVGRTVRRVVRREELWNGNREPIRSLVAWDPSKSIVRWAYTQHDKYRERYEGAMRAPAYRHLTFVRPRSRTAVERWLGDLS